MNTKILMTLSALMLGAAGIILTFMPEEVSRILKTPELASIILQLLGALYFAFAMLNWTAKGNLIGGIYSKPVAIANFTHFMIGGLALVKLAVHDLNHTFILIAAVLYLLFALLFGWVLFTSPGFKK